MISEGSSTFSHRLLSLFPSPDDLDTVILTEELQLAKLLGQLTWQQSPRPFSTFNERGVFTVRPIARFAADAFQELQILMGVASGGVCS